MRYYLMFILATAISTAISCAVNPVVVWPRKICSWACDSIPIDEHDHETCCEMELHGEPFICEEEVDDSTRSI